MKKLLILAILIFTLSSLNAQLIQHLDAIAEASIVKDGTNSVSSWQDQSGVGNHASALTGKIYHVTQAEKSWLDFGPEQNSLQLFSPEASDSWLDQSSGSGGFCVLIAFKINGIVSNWNDLIGNSTAVGSGFGLRYGNSGNIQGYLGGKTINKGGSSLSVGDKVVYAFNYDSESGVCEFWD